MTIEKKNKLIYSGELIIIAIVFLVLGLLELIKVINLSERFQLIFKIITLVGATWITFDFFWTLLNQKRRRNNSLLDKTMMLPVAIYLFAYDIAGFVMPRPYEYYQIGVPVVFFLISIIYVFQGIYHYYKPIPLILQAIEEEELEKEKKEETAETVDKEIEKTQNDDNEGEK